MKSSYAPLRVDLFLFGLLAWASGVAAQPPLERPAGETVRADAPMELFLRDIALAQQTLADDAVIVLEGWNEGTILDLKPVLARPGIALPNESVTLRLNPDMPRFSIDLRGKSIKEALDLICGLHGSMGWEYDQKYNVINIWRIELKQEARWPFNRILGEDGKRVLTLGEAHDLLASKYGLSEFTDSDSFMGCPTGEACNDAVVWEPDDRETVTVRMLVNAVVRHVHSRPRWYKIFLGGIIDPRRGLLDVATLESFRWAIGPKVHGFDPVPIEQ